MDKTNQKAITLSFAAAAAIIGVTAHLLLRTFATISGFMARLTDSDLVRHGVPVLIGVAVFAALQFNPRINTWADEVVTELRKVVFPSRKDVIAMTIVTIIMVLISSVIITSFDFVSAYALGLLMK